MSFPYDAVLLIAFGGPTGPAEIRPFLARVTKGTLISPERIEEVAHHYEAVGGQSPLNDITFRQAQALQKRLRETKGELRVYVGLRNAAPFLVDALRQMANDGVKRALGFILSSHHSEASWERYQENIADARAELGDLAPQVDYCDGWHDHPLFVQTWAELIGAATDAIEPEVRADTPLILTAHSLPEAMAARSLYVEQLQTSARLIGARLGQPHWSIAYQSRSGRPADPWLEPDIRQTIRDCAARGDRQIVVAPIGFVCDHVEVLYDLDIEAKQLARGLGIAMVRAGCPNDHPTFIRMMADVVNRKLKQVEDR